MAAAQARVIATQELRMRIVPFPPSDVPPDPRLEAGVRRLLLLGALLVIAWPAARGSSQWLGALPLWLLAMPAVSWWALHRFRLPRIARPVSAHRRRRLAQARRRPGARALPKLRRAA
jgi:hypothetical protein